MSSQLSWSLYGDDKLSQTLDKLDKVLVHLGLDFDHVGNKAANAGRQMDTVSSQGSRLNNSLREVEGGTSRVGQVVGAAAGIIKGFGVAAVLALGTAGVAAFDFGLKTAASNETAMVSFDLLLGSQQKAMVFMADLQKFAAATPFDMPTLRDASSRLLAVGVAAKDVIPLLTKVGDATAGMGTGADGIARAVYALQQIKSGGVAQMDDLNQLSDAGIPIIDALAAHFHTTALKIRKEMAPGGLITADAVFGALETGEGPAFQRLSGMMAKQSATLEGIWSSAKDNIGQTLAKAVQPFLPAVKKVVDWTATNVPKAIDFLEHFGSRVAHLFDGSTVPQELMDALERTGSALIPEVKEAFEELLNTIRDNKAGLEALGRYIAQDVIPVAGRFILIAIQLGMTLAELGTEVAGHTVAALRVLATTFLTVAGTIIHAADDAFGWLPVLGPKLDAAAAKFDDFKNSVLADLASMDGHTADVYVDTHGYGAKGEHGGSGTGSGSTAISPKPGSPIVASFVARDNNANPAGKGHARGGPNSQGWMMTGEEGAEIWYSTQPGMTRTHSQTQGMTGGGGDIEVVAPASIDLEGFGVWQGLIRFKRRSGIASLGFEDK